MAAFDQRAITRYYFTLTGAGDSLDDVEIPIIGFYGELRDNQPSYLQITIPGVEYEIDITDRPNGTLIIEMAEYVDGVENFRETIFDEFDFESLTIDAGTKTQTITMGGHKTKDFTPDTRNVNDILLYRCEDKAGKCLYRIKPHPDIHPGDTIEETSLFNDSFTGNLISYMVDEADHVMMIQEDASIGYEFKDGIPFVGKKLQPPQIIKHHHAIAQGPIGDPLGRWYQRGRTNVEILHSHGFM